MDQRNEVTIVGAGPAGIAAAIYLKRAGVPFILLEKDQLGGLLRQAFLVENYPGFPGGITGSHLVDQMISHLHSLGISMTNAEVIHVKKEKETFLVKTNQGCFESSVMIIATGTHPRRIPLKGSASLENTRLFYDPYMIPFKGKKEKKRILVIGGGDIAFDYTMTLLKLGQRVTILSRSEPTCLALLQDRVRKNGARLLTACQIREIRMHPKGMLLRCQQNKQELELSADVLLIACGREPNREFLGPRLKKHLDGQGSLPQTPLPGLFVAGDVIRGTYRQTGIAVGDGIHAAMMAHRHLREGGMR